MSVERTEPVPVMVGRVSPGWHPEVVDFVRQAYRRRPVVWPDLYDELTRMASRSTFRGLGFAELAELGLSFSLCELPKLALLVNEVAAEERAMNDRVVEGDAAMAARQDERVEPVPVMQLQPHMLQRAPEVDRSAGARLTMVRTAAG